MMRSVVLLLSICSLLLLTVNAQLPVGVQYGFEAPGLSSQYSYQNGAYGTTGFSSPTATPFSPFTFTTPGFSGIAQKGSPFDDAADSNFGNQYAFLQRQNVANTPITITTTITGLTTGGTYTVTYYYSIRAGFSSGLSTSNPLNVSASINGVIKASALISSLIAFTPATFTFVAVAGTNTLTFAAFTPGNGADVSALLDNIQVSGGSGITGDPQFTGLRGQNFQVHGVPGEVFNIISDEDLQYNAKFVFLHSGKCPVDPVTGVKVATACFSHDGTYLGELGIQTLDDDRVHLVAGQWNKGISEVSVNDVQLLPGDSMDLSPSGYVKVLTSHVVEVQAGNFWFQFSNSDMFFNQGVRMLNSSSTTSHGLLGQTWSKKIYRGASIPFIEGHPDDYMSADHQLFSHSFTFNRFDVDCVDQEKETDNHEHTHQAHL